MGATPLGPGFKDFILFDSASAQTANPVLPLQSDSDLKVWLPLLLVVPCLDSWGCVQLRRLKMAGRDGCHCLRAMGIL